MNLSKKDKPFISILVLLLFVPVLLAAQAALQDVPSKIDPAKKYLFFLHGKIVEDGGKRPSSPQYGVYEYEKILAAFQEKGFIVISEARKRNTDMEEYAKKVNGQIQKLLDGGLAPENITVAGASKGGAIAVLVSTLVKSEKINYAIIAGCSNWLIRNCLEKKRFLHGNVLSIYDRKDPVGISCRAFFDASKGKGLNKTKEIALDLNMGHGFHYRPLKEWVDPIAAWAGAKGGDKKSAGAEEGKGAFEKHCSQCHAKSRALKAKKDLSGWRSTVRRMAGKPGSRVPKDKIEHIAGYLSSL